MVSGWGRGDGIVGNNLGGHPGTRALRPGCIAVAGEEEEEEEG